MPKQRTKTMTPPTQSVQNRQIHRQRRQGCWVPADAYRVLLLGVKTLCNWSIELTAEHCDYTQHH